MKRRDFVIKGSLAGAAVASSTYAFAGLNSFKEANDKVRIGIIGTGSRGNGLIPFINDIKNLDVVACCDVLPFRLQEGVSRASGKVAAYDNHKRMLENKDVDAVLVSVPFGLHAGIAIEALDAGKHVYCEKTMAKGYTDIQKVVNKVENTGAIFQTGHQYHSSRLYTHVVGLIKNGKIGNITAFECQWNRHGDWRRAVPRPELERLVNWRMYREYSGGLTAELCSHQIDFVNWVLESTPEKVMGMGGIDYWKDGRETYDNIHLVYGYPNGVKATFMCLTSNALDDYQIKVMGDKGTIFLDYNRAWFYPEGTYKKKGEIDGVAGATVPWEKGKGIAIDVQHEEPSKQALMDFTKNIINNEMPESNVHTGAKTAIAVQMALDAMHDDKIVSWKESLKV